MKIISNILMFFIIGLRPLFGPATCRHAISCTQYAREQLTDKTFLKAIWLIFKRVLSCNPFSTKF